MLERLTHNQARLLSDVADATGGYWTRDGNEDRTMHSLRRRGLVFRIAGTGYWQLSEAGADIVATWDARGSM